MMIVAGSEKEINTVVQTLNPDYPYQSFAEIEKECCYVVGGVTVILKIVRDQEENND